MVYSPTNVAAFPADNFTMYSVGNYFSIRYPKGWFIVDNYELAKSGVKLTVLSRMPSVKDAGGIPKDMIKTDVVVRPQPFKKVVAQVNEPGTGKRSCVASF